MNRCGGTTIKTVLVYFSTMILKAHYLSQRMRSEAFIDIYSGVLAIHAVFFPLHSVVIVEVCCV